jgi:hypothetical protein
MVFESKTGYICNFEIYSGKSKKLEETILSILEPYKNMWYHLYQDNYYNSVEIAKKLFENKIRVCGTLRSNRGVPKSLRDTKLATNHTAFVRDNDIIIHSWNNGKRTINMISTIHSANMINSGKICRKTKKIIHKPCAVIDYNKYMKDVDRADQYLSYYSIFRKTKKWTKRVVMFLINPPTVLKF